MCSAILNDVSPLFQVGMGSCIVFCFLFSPFLAFIRRTKSTSVSLILLAKREKAEKSHRLSDR